MGRSTQSRAVKHTCVSEATHGRSKQLIIGAVKESRPGETRVAVTPATVKALLGLGYEVVVEPGAGALSSFPDEAYVEAGASVGDALTADVVFGVNGPDPGRWTQGYAAS